MAFEASWLQQQLGKELEQLRVASGLSTRDVAKVTGLDHSTVARMERAQNQIDPQNIIKLGRLYKVADVEIERLCEMARSSRTDIWWERYKSWLAESYYDAIGYENDATKISVTHPAVLHGLLQTRGYAEALFESGVVVVDPDRIEVLVEVRQLRQRRLIEPQPLELVAVIPESVLYTAFGGAEVMHEQLEHLRDMMKLNNVDLRVLPSASPVSRYPLTLIEFGAEEGPAIAVSETAFGDFFHDEPMQIRQTRRIFRQLLETALSPSESADIIEHRISEGK